ncbi:MAG: AmmeMemoRadiSam system protein B [Phycisphaeraceae bacterium]
MTLHTRPAAVAGRFYPADAAALREAVDRYIAQGHLSAQAGRPKAIIGPHAGYRYSGPIAGSAYAALASLRGSIRRVVLLGPAHYVGFPGIAVSGADAFATPLGDVPVDHAACQALQALPFVHSFDAAHTPEHGLEVHLPFLLQTLGEFALVPLLFGRTNAGEAAQALDAVWGGDETLIVISSDLSHYHDYATAQLMDQATARFIEALDGGAIHADHACGRIAIQGLLKLAAARGLHAVTLDLRNSGDTAGPREEVVGYGAWLFA